MERNETFFPMDTGVAPPFYQIDPNKFQFVCRDVLERQRDAGVVSCGIYGTGGQAQYGIDLIAPLAESETNAVAQCKRYPKITPQEIVDASDAFLEHLSHWENFAVRRFILIVACAMDRRQQQDELQRQRKRFAAHGIEYEWWDARGLRQRLAPHRDIVRLYFPAPSQYWEETICGKEPEPLSFTRQPAPSYPFTLSLFESQLEQFSIQFSADVSGEIDSIRELNREGKGEEAYVLINKLRAGKKWDLLPNELKGRILRVTVGLELGQTGDVSRAQSFLDQALAYDPGADYSIARALLRYYENGEKAEAALKELATPITVDAFNLKLALLVEKGSLQDGLDLIRQLPPDIVADAGTHHAHALALLGVGDREGAKEAIRTARELKPRWESIRSVAAIINYYESISPAAQPAHHLGWPQAVAWSYLKRDDETLTRLREAESHFAVLAQRSKQTLEHRAYFEIWRLACLANDPERQPSAGEFCRQLLAENPANHRALAWAANRNFGVDFDTSVAALERVAAEPVSVASDDRVESLVVLVALYLRDEKYVAAEKLLRRKQDELKRLGFGDLVSLWWGRVYAAKGQLKKALSVSQRTSNSEIRRQLKLTALREKLGLTGKWKPLARCLEKDYRKTRNSQNLFELCQLKAAHGLWRFVADRADHLITLVGTPDAVRLAAIATLNAGYPARCLDVLESSLHLFPRGKLSNELLLVKVNCQRRLGSLARALLDAEELVAREDTDRNILSLIEVQLQKADLKGLAITARRILHREDFKTADILRVAKLVSFEDTELAAKLWRRALAGVLSEPALVGDAIGLGYALALDKELTPLQSLMHNLAEEGKVNIRSLSLTEAVEDRKQRARRLTEIFGDYTHGRIMLHVFADEAQAAVADWLHGFASQNGMSDALRHRPGIFTRHGGRSIKTCALPSDTSVRLHLDVTALLLATELGILDVVEARYQPIRISEAMPLALVRQLALLSPSQPTQYKININVLEQVEQKKLQIIPQGSELALETEWGLTEEMGEGWVRIAHQAKKEAAFVVDHLPLMSLRNGEQVDVPPSLVSHVINCRSIADALLTHGPLSNTRHEAAIENLGSEAFPVLNFVPPAKARLYLMGASADVLAAADLLNLACLHFQVFIPEAVVQLAQAGVQEHTHRVEMIDWVQKLLERVRDGIDHRVYEIIPAPEEPEQKELEKVAHNYDLKTFGDLLNFQVESGDVIWVDDRYVNAYGHRAGAPIVTVIDVLQDLLRQQQITEADYYGKLLQLRRSNIRYLPLEANEVVFHLRSAQVSHGVVVETEELAVLRRYIAACLLDGENLQKSPQPPGSANVFGEIKFVYETITSVVDALAALWSDETMPAEDAEVRAEWLLTNVYTGRFGCVHLLPEAVKHQGDELHLVGVDIAELFAKGIAVGERQILNAMSASLNTPAGSETTEDLSRRQRYFQWLGRRVVAPRVKADPGSMDAASQVIRNIVRASSEREHGPQEQRHVRMLMQQLYLDLPSELQGHIKQDPQLLSWIGIRVAESINVNGISLPPDEFWQGAEVAINNSETTIEGFNGPVRIKKGTTQNLAPSSGNDNSLAQSENCARVEAEALELYDESGRLLTRFKHTILGLMSTDVSERVRTLNTNGHLFDVDPQMRARQITEIASAHSPRERVDRATAYGKQSAAAYYLGLEQSLTATKSFQRNDLTGMTATGLLQYYRLHHTEAGDRVPFPQALSAAAIRLLSEQGVETALDRMASLPVRIADQIVEEIRGLETEQQDALLTRFGERHCSPLGKLHLIDLYLRLDHKSEATSRKARSVVQELFDKDIGAQRFKVFKSILLAVNEEFGFWSDAAQWPNDIRLAMVWGHATNWYDLISSTLITGEKDLLDLSDWFTSPYRQFCVEMLHYNSEYVRDCAHPAQINRLEFLSLAAPELLACHGATALEEIGLLDNIRNVGFDQRDGLRIPAPELLGDTALLTNLTGSFLAGDKPALLGLVGGPEVSDFVTSGNLRNIVSLQIQELSANSMDERHWLFIASVLKGQPLYRELQHDFKRLIHGLNFDLVLSTNREAAIAALMVASEQSSGLGDVERSTCENWLMKYIQDFGDRFPYKHIEPDADASVDLSEELAMILECAVALAVRLDDPRASGMAFSGLVRRMLDTWSGLSDHLPQVLQRSVFELPVSQLDGMWLVVLTGRASRCIN